MTITILYIHGINVEEPGYSAPLHKNIAARLYKGGFWDHVAQAEVFWGDLFSPSAHKLLQLMRQQHLGGPAIRKVTLDTVAQALGYEDTVGVGSYERVHERVAGAIHLSAIGTGARGRVFVVAHSLGTLVASNYLWDLQHHAGIFRRGAWDDAQRLTNLGGLFTMGSPLALYNSRWNDFGAPIHMASQGTPWWNLIESYDPLAWPLKGINEAYGSEVTQDVRIQPRWWDLKRRTPLAHAGYWTSKPVAATIGDRILSVIRPKKEAQ